MKHQSDLIGSRGLATVDGTGMTMPTQRPTSAVLTRRLGLVDAVTVGVGSMIGAGVFTAWGPAAEAAGTGLLIGLAVAAVVAFCNATSSAQLAAQHPESGGTYVFARRQLGASWGHLAGWAFVHTRRAGGLLTLGLLLNALVPIGLPWV